MFKNEWTIPEGKYLTFTGMDYEKKEYSERDVKAHLLCLYDYFRDIDPSFKPTDSDVIIAHEKYKDTIEVTIYLLNEEKSLDHALGIFKKQGYEIRGEEIKQSEYGKKCIHGFIKRGLPETRSQDQIVSDLEKDIQEKYKTDDFSLHEVDNTPKTQSLWFELPVYTGSKTIADDLIKSILRNH